MPAAVISILKWLVTTILVPLAEKWIAAWLKSKEKAKKLRDIVKGNKAKEEAYEKDPSDDNFSNLP
jgi:hypothetical protein